MSSIAYDVRLNGKLIDTVFTTDTDVESVKKSLINHDGYDSRITVRKAPKKRLKKKIKQVKHLLSGNTLFVANTPLVEAARHGKALSEPVEVNVIGSMVDQYRKDKALPDAESEEYESPLEHRSSPNGCDDDCPACADEQAHREGTRLSAEQKARIEAMSIYTEAEWRQEIAMGDTRLGYEDWVNHAVEANGGTVTWPWPGNDERDMLEGLVNNLVEAHQPELDADHHGDDPETCSYCRNIAAARKILACK